MKQGYTDAPELHPNLILGSLHLLFWLFFHPAAWRSYVHRLDPDLRPDFILADLNRSRWRISPLRRLLVQSCIILPLLVGLPLGLSLWANNTPLEFIIATAAYGVAISFTLGLIMAAVVSVAAGLAAGLTVALAAGLVGSLVDRPLEQLIVPAAVGLAIGLAGSIAVKVAQQPSPVLSRYISKLQMQVGGVVVGILIGVVAIGAMGTSLTTLAMLTAGLPESLAYNLARATMVGVSFGLAIGWRCGFKVGLAAGLLVCLAYSLAVAGRGEGAEPLIAGLASGLLFGLSFGVTMVLPYVLTEHLVGPWAAAWAGALGSWGRHVFRNNIPLLPGLPLGLVAVSLGLSQSWWRPLLLYPFCQAWNLVLFRLEEWRSGRPPRFLRWHAAFWDEFQRLPFVGLDEYLLLVWERDPAEGQAALDYLRASRQRWAAQAVQIELEARRLEACHDVMEISQLHQSLVSGRLAGPASLLLLSFTRLSQDIEAALHQTSLYHRRLALRSVDDRLNALLREMTVSSGSYATRFYPVAEQWRQLVVAYLAELAAAADHRQEIENPYVVGVPITEEQEIFVGRADIVARIEQLLLGQQQPPVLLYGQRRMGKTSLLRNLGRLLPGSIVPLFVDGQRISLANDYPDFLYNLAAEMERSAARQRSLTLPVLSRQALAASPFTCFNEWLDEVEQLLAAQGYAIALLTLDEFEMLASIGQKGRFDETDVLSMLRHIIQHRPLFKVLLAGSHPLEEFHHWAGYLINVQVIKMDYLALEEARQLIECPVQNFGLTYEPEASRRVLALTRCHPALVQLLCYEIVTLKNEQEAAQRDLVCLADVETAVSRALASGSFFFADIQQNQVDGIGLALLRCLAARGEGVLASRADLAGCHPGSPAELDRAFNMLLRRDLIEAVGTGYRFQVELVRRWFAQAH